MPLAPLLRQFVDDELGRAPALIERTLAGALQLLRDARDSPLAANERAHQLAIVGALQANRAAYQSSFLKALSEAVHEALDESQRGLVTDPLVESAGLELMDESRVEIDIEISRAMQLIDTTAEWELRELQTFTSTLMGQTHITAESNPFRPAVYASALWQATGAVSDVPIQRTLLLRTSAVAAAGLLKSAWAAASTRLEAQGVEPGAYRTVLLTSGSTAGRNGSLAQVAGESAELATLLASMPAGSAGMQVGTEHAAIPMGDPSAARTNSGATIEDALAGFEELLRQMPRPDHAAPESTAALLEQLETHRAALVASASAPIERQVIELLSRMFDAVLSDPQLPPAFVAVLARLQASALRVALREPDMLSSTQHPTWQLLDRIGEAGAAYPQVNDARAIAVRTFCDSIAGQLARTAAPDSTLYRRAAAQLQSFLSDQLAAQRLAADETTRALQLNERRDLLEQSLSRRLADQIGPTQITPGIRRFMTGPWAQVLAEAMLRFGDESERTRSYIKLVDELLWSVKLPDHPQSRQRLVALLPSLLKRLRDGMQMISLPAAEQDAVIDELMAIHTDALRPGRADAATLTPQEIVQRMRDEVLPATTGHGGFSDSVIDLASMQTVPAELMPSEAPPDDPVKRVDALREADRLRMFLQGRWARVQLLWRSEQSLFFLFAGESESRTHSVTRRALERLSAEGLMQPLETRTLVQRALDNVARELVNPN